MQQSFLRPFVLASVVWFLGATGLAAQQSGPTPAFAAVQGAFFALSVPDLDSSIDWYSDKLGLRVTSRFDQGKIKGAILAGRGLEVELMSYQDSGAPRDPADIMSKVLVPGITKVGIRVPDFEATLSLLRQRGVAIALGPFPARVDQRANALIRDNAGNLIQLFGDFAK